MSGLEDISTLAEFTPSFMWLLRDFYYDLEDKGVRVSAGQSHRKHLLMGLLAPGVVTPTANSNATTFRMTSAVPDVIRKVVAHRLYGTRPPPKALARRCCH